VRIFTYLFLLAIVLLGITFAILNSQVVSVNYYLGQQTFHLSLLMALTFAVGSLVGLLVGAWLLFKIKLTNYRLRQRIELAEKEIDNLRAIPLQDKH
jgi:putative membrane protein